jgi:hypothetical protein
MQTLFNKTGYGIEEIRKHLSFLFATIEFSNLEPHLHTAQHKLGKIISPEVITAALAHYHSANYPEGTGEGQPALTTLVNNLRKSLALQAYLDYAPLNDLIHDASGRRANVDENSRQPYQWQIDQEETKVRELLYTAIEELLATITTLTTWKSTSQYKKLQTLWPNTLEVWESTYPIDQSLRLLLLLSPFAIQAQEAEIAPTIGRTVYDTIIAKRKGDNNTALTAHETTIIELANPAIIHLAMAKALLALPVKIWPEGIMQSFTGDRTTSRAKQVADKLDRRSQADYLTSQAIRNLRALQDYLTNLALQEQSLTYEPKSYHSTTKKFFRT